MKNRLPVVLVRMILDGWILSALRGTGGPMAS